jgi:hypothetical protein
MAVVVPRQQLYLSWVHIKYLQLDDAMLNGTAAVHAAKEQLLHSVALTP